MCVLVASNEDGGSQPDYYDTTQYRGDGGCWKGISDTDACYSLIALIIYDPSQQVVPIFGRLSFDYTINRTFNGASFDDVEGRVRKALSDSGFGILTEIDVKTTMKKKLDVEMPAYRILGACNPKMAYEAIRMEPRVGAMLPCNVILRVVEGGVEVSAIDPVASMQAIDNPDLHAVAGQVRDLLTKAVTTI